MDEGRTNGGTYYYNKMLASLIFGGGILSRTFFSLFILIGLGGAAYLLFHEVHAISVPPDLYSILAFYLRE